MRESRRLRKKEFEIRGEDSGEVKCPECGFNSNITKTFKGYRCNYCAKTFIIEGQQKL